jgi:hypothetical protein
MTIHDRVRDKIEAGEPCHAQATINGQLVSMHPGFTGFDMTFSGNLVVRRPLASGDRLGYARGVMIDLWVRGEAAASPGTFTAEQLERRAREHEHGNGPGILRGAGDAAFAERIRAFAQGNADALAAEPCPH